jgi:hypothetical protein
MNWCVGDFPPHQMPLYWGFSLLGRTPLEERIRLLVLTVESQPNLFKMKLPYERTRDHFIYSVGYIRNHDPNPRAQLDMLCHETIHKLHALMDLSDKLGVQESTPVAQRSQLAPPNPPLEKTELSMYMTSWLRENWINPYPDEGVMKSMARDCGTTPTVVNNWLINARTRKWRPAIMKAYEMKRPAELLLEDSINIFSGEPLRKLDSVDDMLTSPSKRSRHA